MASMVRRKFFAVIGALPFVGKLAVAKSVAVDPDPNFIHSPDARVWADAFVAYVKKNPAIALDPGCMTGWFANAIMRGHDDAVWREVETRRQWMLDASTESLRDLRKENITGAVARGWCADVNRHKVMDGDLAFAIVDELMKLRA